MGPRVKSKQINDFSNGTLLAIVKYWQKFEQVLGILK